MYLSDPSHWSPGMGLINFPILRAGKLSHGAVGVVRLRSLSQQTSEHCPMPGAPGSQSRTLRAPLRPLRLAGVSAGSPRSSVTSLHTCCFLFSPRRAVRVGRPAFPPSLGAAFPAKRSRAPWGGSTVGDPTSRVLPETALSHRSGSPWGSRPRLDLSSVGAGFSLVDFAYLISLVAPFRNN